MDSKLVKAKTTRELLDFLQLTRQQSNFTLEKTVLSGQNAWGIGDGVLSHVSRGFFQVTGVRNRENPSDAQLMLYQPQGAITGLMIHRAADEVFLLLQARVEPGNTNITQFGPTIQSTPANYLKLHGGRATSYFMEFSSFSKGINLLTHSMQHDLGKRYFQKSKTHHYLEADVFIETEENMIWASLGSIKGAMNSSNVLNADLRSLLSVFDWDGFVRGRKKPGRNLMNDALNKAVNSAEQTENRVYQLTDLEPGYHLTDEGVSHPDQKGISVNLFHFSCTNREVAAWTQPLYCVEGTGLVQLLVRQVNGRYEFLVSVYHECGLSTNHAIMPSLVLYGEENGKGQPVYAGEVIREMVQCDEGGRFYRNDSLYQVIMVKDEMPVRDDQAWISVEQLKYLLESSNRCSFQLRCISSMLLDVLNAAAF